jgi:hypothetical protein
MSKLIKLGTAIELREQLVSVIDEPHLITRLYPIIEKSAGKELDPDGVIMMLTLAIDAYCKKTPIMFSFLDRKMPDYIAAIITDEELKKQTVELFNEVYK